MAQLEVVILNLTLLLFPGHRPGPEEGTLGLGTRLRKLLWAPPRPAPGPPGAHLEEDGRVLLVDPHQLHVGHGVDAAHGQAGQRHDGGQHLHVPAEGDGGRSGRTEKIKNKRFPHGSDQTLAERGYLSAPQRRGTSP